MPLALPVMLALAQACAPSVAPATLLSVAHAESGFDPLVIGVNGRRPRTLHPSSAQDAIGLATALIADGRNVDLGLAQINARNLRRLRLTLAEAFDPCRNLAGGARILADDYAVARREASGPQAALNAALSAYNTGDPMRGLQNGYVARVQAAAAEVVPAISAVASWRAAPPATVRLQPLKASAAAPLLPSLDVFASGPSQVLVWSQAFTPTAGPVSARPFTSTAGDPS